MVFYRSGLRYFIEGLWVHYTGVYGYFIEVLYGYFIEEVYGYFIEVANAIL